MTTIAHLMKTFTLREFVKAHWLIHARHAELVSASYFLNVGIIKTLKRVQGDDRLGMIA